MVIDTTDWRKLIAFAPRWAKVALSSSIVVGECLFVLTKLFEPIMTDLRSWVDVSQISTAEWPFIGILITMPVAFLWHTLVLSIRGPTDFEKAEEYISIMNLAAVNARYTKANESLFWHAAIQKLADHFSVGAKPPSARELAKQIQTDDDTVSC